MKVFALIFFFISSCASSRLCEQGGDISWEFEIKGDRFCRQIKAEDGRYINHGRYYVKSSKGVILLEGQFEQGEKDGVWEQFNEKGKKIRERYFDKGVEKPAVIVKSGD